MAISPQQLTIYLYSAHRAVIFAIAQLSCMNNKSGPLLLYHMCQNFANFSIFSARQHVEQSALYSIVRPSMESYIGLYAIYRKYSMVRLSTRPSHGRVKLSTREEPCYPSETARCHSKFRSIRQQHDRQYWWW